MSGCERRRVRPIKTKRLTLRPLRREDAAALFPTLSDPEQCRGLSHPAFESEEALWAWLSDPDWNGRSWIAEDAQGAVAGRFVAVPAHEEGVEEIGYITCTSHQRTGIAREGAAALIEHLLTTPIDQGGARKLIAVVDVTNAASIRLTDALGFTREALFREHETTHEGLCDVYVYGLLKSDKSA